LWLDLFSFRAASPSQVGFSFRGADLHAAQTRMFRCWTSLRSFLLSVRFPGRAPVSATARHCDVVSCTRAPVPAHEHQFRSAVPTCAPGYCIAWSASCFPVGPCDWVSVPMIFLSDSHMRGQVFIAVHFLHRSVCLGSCLVLPLTAGSTRALSSHRLRVLSAQF
jgi:hypothetical protein